MGSTFCSSTFARCAILTTPQFRLPLDPCAIISTTKKAFSAWHVNRSVQAHPVAHAPPSEQQVPPGGRHPRSDTYAVQGIQPICTEHSVAICLRTIPRCRRPSRVRHRAGVVRTPRKNSGRSEVGFIFCEEVSTLLGSGAMVGFVQEK